MYLYLIIAISPGLEPRLTDSESVVLPITPRDIGYPIRIRT